MSFIGPHLKLCTCILFKEIKVYWVFRGELKVVQFCFLEFFWVKVIDGKDKTSQVLKVYFPTVYDSK